MFNDKWGLLINDKLCLLWAHAQVVAFQSPLGSGAAFWGCPRPCYGWDSSSAGHLHKVDYQLQWGLRAVSVCQQCLSAVSDCFTGLSALCVNSLSEVCQYCVSAICQQPVWRKCLLALSVSGVCHRFVSIVCQNCVSQVCQHCMLARCVSTVC